MLVQSSASQLMNIIAVNLAPLILQVFIGGIPKSATEEQVREFAEQAGKVRQAVPSGLPALWRVKAALPMPDLC